MRTTSANRYPYKKLAMCLLLSGFLAGTLFGILADVQAAEPVVDRVQAFIKARLNGEQATSSLVCQGEMICGIQMLPAAYRNKNYMPLWFGASLRLEKAESLAEAIQRASEDGLTAQDYHLEAIYDILAEICEQASAMGPAATDPELWADLDLILTDAFLLYGSHLSAGRVNPETLHTDWKVNPGAIDLKAHLDSATTTGDIEAALDRLRPVHSEYQDLRKALARLRNQAAAGGWPAVDFRQTLQPGDHGIAVGALRRRLIVSGDLSRPAPGEDPLYFDDALATAVKHFQQRNGLKTDGIVGRATYGMLNMTAEERIQQVVLNLERWRWLPNDLGARYVMVNTADFKLKAVDDGQEALQMRVVVGRPARRSPVFSAKMTYLVANPYWNVPTTIAVEDILPELQKDVSYLTPRGIRVFENWHADAGELDPTTIDWQAYHANRFPFRLRQDPGPDNALGRIKFMFPNQFAVYLHDTPNRSLFKRVQRDFSSGCIRVESPDVLAEFVLATDKNWTMDKLNEVIEKGEPRIIRIKHPIPVHLLYMTAWVDQTEGIQFRSDIYDRDRDLSQALGQRRPNTPPDFTRQP